MKRASDIWLLVFLFVLLLVGGYFAAGPRASKENKDSTTWNSDPNGVRAFYTLLGDRLGYRVERLHKPFDEMPESARLLVVVQPVAAPGSGDSGLPFLGGDAAQGIGADEAAALEKWIRRGGTAIFFSDAHEGIPAEFRFDRRIGRGSVYAFDSRRAVTNRGMRDYRNAVSIIRIIDRHAGKKGLIVFDEYHHGFAESKPLTSYVGRQVWIALGILLVAGIILCHTRGKRFGAVRDLPPSETVRPGFEFVRSLARIYQRAGATDLAADILRSTGPPARSAEAGTKPTEQELLAILNRHSERSEESARGSSLRSE